MASNDNQYAIQFQFQASNNEAEYEAILAAFGWPKN